MKSKVKRQKAKVKLKSKNQIASVGKRLAMGIMVKKCGYWNNNRPVFEAIIALI